jgi:hypothetical protein
MNTTHITLAHRRLFRTWLYRPNPFIPARWILHVQFFGGAGYHYPQCPRDTRFPWPAGRTLWLARDCTVPLALDPRRAYRRRPWRCGWTRNANHIPYA